MSWRTIVVSSSAKLDYQLGYRDIHIDNRINSSLFDSSTSERIDEKENKSNFL